MQYITKEEFREFIRSFDFSGLFNRLGWNYLEESIKISLDGIEYILKQLRKNRVSGFLYTQEISLPIVYA